MPQPPPEHPEQLRDHIDRGATGDKVPWPDPAAAPLGTDEEAAGTPVSSHAVRTAHAHETRPAAAPPKARWHRAALAIAALAALAVLTWLVARA